MPDQTQTPPPAMATLLERLAAPAHRPPGPPDRTDPAALVSVADLDALERRLAARLDATGAQGAHMVKVLDWMVTTLGPLLEVPQVARALAKGRRAGGR